MIFSRPIKNYIILITYIILLTPIPVYFYLGLMNRLGPDPVKFLEHKYGELALIFLILTLSITPLLKIFKVNLTKYRRCFGLVTFYYVIFHILIYLIFDIGLSLDLLVSDLKKRYYIIAGFFSFMLLVPLAVTSSDKAVKRLSPKYWKRLHRLVFIALSLSIIHFILLSKTWTIELLAYTLTAIIILLLRIKFNKYRLIFFNIFNS